MNTPRLLVILTALNVGVLLLGIAQQVAPAFAQEPSVLRARALQILQAKANSSSLKLRAEDGHERTLIP